MFSRGEGPNRDVELVKAIGDEGGGETMYNVKSNDPTAPYDSEHGTALPVL